MTYIARYKNKQHLLMLLAAWFIIIIPQAFEIVTASETKVDSNNSFDSSFSQLLCNTSRV